ncbi:MAG: hypothetical protein ACC661_05445 [Verrucomicrobiales bacterium]
MSSRVLSLFLFACVLAAGTFLASCANDPGNEKLKSDLARRNAAHADSIERRALRRNARDQRYDAWFDMIMQ